MEGKKRTAKAELIDVLPATANAANYA